MSKQFPRHSEAFVLKPALASRSDIDLPRQLAVEPSEWQSRFGAAGGARFDVCDGDTRWLAGGTIEQVIAVLNEWHIANERRTDLGPELQRALLRRSRSSYGAGGANDAGGCASEVGSEMGGHHAV